MIKSVSGLDNKQLDWAFAAAMGYEIYQPEDIEALGVKETKNLSKVKPVLHLSADGLLVLCNGNHKSQYSPTLSWNHSASVWSKTGTTLTNLTDSARNQYGSGTVGTGRYEARVGATVVRDDVALVALCRAVVINKFGSAVELPVMLWG